MVIADGLRSALKAGEPLATWPGLDAWWGQVAMAVKSACPSIDLQSEPLLAALGSRLGALEVPEVEALAAVDLIIAVAALQGDKAALAELDRRLVLAARHGLRVMRLSPSDIDEASQQTRELLLVPAGSSPARLATYAGRGPLDAWLRAVAAREALAIRRRQGASEELNSAFLHPGPGAESGLRDAQHGAAVRAALEGAFAALTSHQRTLLRLHTLDNLSLASIGVMYGKDGSTISRRLLAAREEVRARAITFLRRRLGLDASGAESVLRATGAGTDATLDRLLASGTISD